MPGNSAPFIALSPRTKLLSLFFYGVAILLAPNATVPLSAAVVIFPLIIVAGLRLAFIWRQLATFANLFMTIAFAFQAVLTPGEGVSCRRLAIITREGL